MLKLVINVDDVNDLLGSSSYGTGALLRVERSSTGGGSGFSELTTTALVADQTQYEVWDSSGTTSLYYRSRYSNSGGTLFSDYSDEWRGGEVVAYATIEDLAETIRNLPASQRNRLSDELGRASDRITARMGRSFYRIPQVSGTVTTYWDVSRAGCDSLSLATLGGYSIDGYPLDVISVTTLSVRDSESDSTYTTIAAGDTGYYLGPGTAPGRPGTDVPYEDIILSPAGTDYTEYPVGRRAVKLVAVLGWPLIPAPVTQATVDWVRETYWVRELYRSGRGDGPLDDEVATAMPGALPRSVYDLFRPWSPYRKQSFAAI